MTKNGGTAEEEIQSQNDIENEDLGTIKGRLRYARKCNRMSLQDVENAFNSIENMHSYKRAAIHSMESGKTQKIKRPVIDAFATIYKVRPAWIETGTGAMRSPTQEASADIILRKYSVPVISWPAAAMKNDESTLSTASEKINTSREYSERAFSLVVPEGIGGEIFAKDMFIVVDPETSYKSGSYVVVKKKDDEIATIRQIIQDGNVNYLQPLNKVLPTTQMTEDDEICGVVRESIQRFD